MIRPTPPSFLSEPDRFGQAIAQHLNRASQDLPSDISERLRVMRLQAIEHRKRPQTEIAPAWSLQALGSSLGLPLPTGESPHWQRMTSFLLLIALVMGLFIISNAAENRWANDMADVDAEILTDDLPPDAYTDPGFIQFLRTQHADDSE